MSTLCGGCEHRAESIRRVEKFVQIRKSRGESPPYSGTPLDIAPKAECKRHRLYGYDDETRAECRDFKPVTP